MQAKLARIVVTPGEPAGIGPDICLMLSQRPHPFEWVVVGDIHVLEARGDRLGIQVDIHAYDPAADPMVHPAGHLVVLHVPVAAVVETGQLNVDNVYYVLNCLDRAVAGCQSGEFSALVTGPINKGIINEAGRPFTGHTEYLAFLTSCPRPVMMLQTTGLRVALATTHLPLKKVSESITQASLTEIITILDHDLRRWMGIQQPSIWVCGLNPHAGENGYLGEEEQEIIEPAIDALRDQGIDVRGPFAADTVFIADKLKKVDVILTMYHDQGLPVLKHMGFGRAVNITLGLPIIRTSVDHGTALPLAGTGQANPGSLAYALDTAFNMTRYNT